MAISLYKMFCRLQILERKVAELGRGSIPETPPYDIIAECQAYDFACIEQLERKVAKLERKGSTSKTPLRKFSARRWDEFLNYCAYNNKIPDRLCLVCLAVDFDCQACNFACNQSLSLIEMVDQLIDRLYKEGVF